MIKLLQVRKLEIHNIYIELNNELKKIVAQYRATFILKFNNKSFITYYGHIYNQQYGIYHFSLLITFIIELCLIS